MGVSVSVKVFAKKRSSMLMCARRYHNNLLLGFFSPLFPFQESGAVQYFVCQNKKTFYPHCLPQGLRLPVNRPEDRADNGKDTTEFLSLENNCVWILHGNNPPKHLWAATPGQYSAVCLWLKVPPSFQQSYPVKRKGSCFTFPSKVRWNAAPEISSMADF